MLDENVQQPLSRLLKLKEVNPILKALLKFSTTKNLFELTTLTQSGCCFFYMSFVWLGHHDK